jgi:hypothetical protein
MLSPFEYKEQGVPARNGPAACVTIAQQSFQGETMYGTSPCQQQNVRPVNRRAVNMGGVRIEVPVSGMSNANVEKNEQERSRCGIRIRLS